MKRKSIKLLSVTMVLIMLCAAVSVLGVSAEETVNETVRVIIQNTNFSTSAGAVWDDVLLSEDIGLTADDSMMSVIVKAVEDKGCTIDISKGYITEINGLSEYANNGSGGWMVSLNDWFTADGAQSYTVANGGLVAGDEITVMYSNDWGEDCGGHFGNFDTSLLKLEVEGASLAEAWSPDQNEYHLLTHTKQQNIKVIPEAYNKNYQTRVYLNEYLPESKDTAVQYKSAFSVQSGDTVYVGIGNPAWPTMNSWSGTAEETIYKLYVEYVPVMGDINGDGEVKIDDVTRGQAYLAEYFSLDKDEMTAADMNHDGKVTINDITAIQRVIAEY